MTTEFRVWSLVFISCIGSRLLSTIYYIEDLDSLRFALSIVDYDVARLQPHFPAYPVFCYIAKLLYAVIRRYALAFSLIGGLSTFFTIYFTLKIANIQSTTLFGKIAIFVVFMNPLLWLMSNRYMPDAMGVACLLASLYFTTAPVEDKRDFRNIVGFFLAGTLIGIRLSYFPLLVPALLIRLKHPGRLKCIIAGAIGILLWLIPLLWITGWNTLITAAQTQSHGHFSDFGGTVSTNSELWLRLTKLFESVWADGFGLYWSGRHLITACTTITIAVLVVSNWRTLKKPSAISSQQREERDVAATETSGLKADSRQPIACLPEKFFGDDSLFLNPIFIGCAVYLVWIFLGQNVIYKSRHVLPLLPFLAVGIAFACNRIIGTPLNNRLGKPLAWGAVIIFFFCYSYVTLNTVLQHTKPTAIAQIHKYLRDKQHEQGDKPYIVSVPLIKYYLVSQAVEATYIPIKSEADLAQLDELEIGLVVIGSPLPNREPKVEKTFYHNPYVNRMWPELPLYEY